MKKKTILKVLVGSYAHGVAQEGISDYDYRGVYLLPTSKILSIGYKYKGTSWLEGKADNTSYELGHFLFLATKCNPTMLETFKAPIIRATKEGRELRKLFPYIWTPKMSFDAFTGYGLNQRKKFLDNKDNRRNKYAVAYVRTLINLIDLLEKKDFSLKVDFMRTKIMRFRNGQYQIGEVIDVAEGLTRMARTRLVECKQKPNLDKVNEFLLKIRKNYW